eukprot:XP_014790622.1 PREDICTED: uncharacterized protein LOC106883977 [Octopus bimaculoides]
MKFLLLQGNGTAEIHGEMKKVLKDGCLSYSIVKIWVSRFQTGHFKVKDEPQSGRPTSATTEDKADAVHVMILEDYWISDKLIAEILGIFHKRIDHIIHNILDTRKFSAKWVPKYLNTNQKHIKVTTLMMICDWFAAAESDFMARLVTMDETWLHHYDPQTKQQSKEWCHSGSLHPKTFWA